MTNLNVVSDETLMNSSKEVLIRMIRVTEKNLEELRANKPEGHVTVGDLVPLITAEWILVPSWEPLPKDVSPFSYDPEFYDEKTHSEKVFSFHCSHCGYDTDSLSKPLHKYCPECGAKIVNHKKWK